MAGPPGLAFCPGVLPDLPAGGPAGCDEPSVEPGLADEGVLGVGVGVGSVGAVGVVGGVGVSTSPVGAADDEDSVDEAEASADVSAGTTITAAVGVGGTTRVGAS